MLNVRDFGARGDGAGDDSAAIMAAVNALPAGGGTVHLPAGTYRTLAAINPGSKAVILQGEGWAATPVTWFGDNAQWLAPGAVRGSVIQCAGSNDGIRISAAGVYQGLHLRDMAILGPGVGTSVGVNFDAPNSQYCSLDNVACFNFSKGIRFANTMSGCSRRLHAWGCETGIVIDGTITDMHLDYVAVQRCGVGLLGLQGSLVEISGGLVQANTLGVKLAPTPSLTVWHLDGLWFEANQTAFQVDTAQGAITTLTLTASRWSDEGAQQICFVGNQTCNFFTLAGNHGGGVDVVIPQHCPNFRHEPINNFRSLIILP